jgi:ribosomal protein S18 acetylase RimI-like enzyme
MIARLPGIESGPDSWDLLESGKGVQLIATDALDTWPAPSAEALGSGDVPEMLDLVSRTRPGPFLARTYLLGSYLGIRSQGRLIAMAGERMRPEGFTEISAVCTDPAFQRQGLAAELVRAVAHAAREHGDTPFMHATATNLNAIRLYKAMGFAVRRELTFASFRAPL